MYFRENDSDKTEKKLLLAVKNMRKWILVTILSAIPFIVTEHPTLILPPATGLFIFSLLQVKLYLDHKACLNIVQGGEFLKLTYGTSAFLLCIIFFLLAAGAVFSWAYFFLYVF
ncbi:hypothetical protein QA601_04125 [Chitinispirillales bacterium ANBcel5]|uniref:hypothetical protein n=1 Tax=Cellulosispirillum alkaliphilum TaxID=3039283 RepID=UPI002A58F0FB|nr:hypothetical protein [Chitinispirillales bacterium ANBcel5]